MHPRLGARHYCEAHTQGSLSAIDTLVLAARLEARHVQARSSVDSPGSAAAAFRAGIAWEREDCWDDRRKTRGSRTEALEGGDGSPHGYVWVSVGGEGVAHWASPDGLGCHVRMEVAAVDAR